jgi:transposase
MSSELRAQQAMLRQLTRTDPDPRVRGRAHALLLLTLDHSVVAVARLFATAPHRVRVWRSRFLAGGRQGLADEPRTGRPPKLDPAALAFLREALEAGPHAYGLPVTIWSIRDLREVLAARLGIRVCTATVHHAVHRLAYHYRRPRHDLTHRQDAEAVAAAEEVLAWLRKKAVTPRRIAAGLPRRVRGSPSSPLGKSLATAWVSGEDPSSWGRS